MCSAHRFQPGSRLGLGRKAPDILGIRVRRIRRLDRVVALDHPWLDLVYPRSHAEFCLFLVRPFRHLRSTPLQRALAPIRLCQAQLPVVATGETQLAQAGNARLASLDHGRSQDRSRAMLVRTILYLYTVAF